MSESDFIASHDISPQHPISDGFYSNVKKIVKLQGYIFETLCDNAVPAAERINQLETGHYSPSNQTSISNKARKVIDRFYVCPQCNATFIIADEAEEHQVATGHGRANEFPFFD